MASPTSITFEICRAIREDLVNLSAGINDSLYATGASGVRRWERLASGPAGILSVAMIASL
jgi:hypothetical protein